MESKKAQPPKLNKVANGKKEENAGGVLAAFISDEAGNIGKYILFDVIVPMIKKGISEAVNIVLYGDNTRNKSGASRISYERYYRNDRDDTEYNPRRELKKDSLSYLNTDVTVATRGEAEEVLFRLEEALALYGSVSIGSYYDLIGMNCPHTMYTYGWYDLSDANVVKVRSGYSIRLPKARPI